MATNATAAAAALPCYGGQLSLGMTCANGLCDPATGSCICATWFSGHGDFVTMVRASPASGSASGPGSASASFAGLPVTLECGMNDIALRVLYGAVLLQYLFACVVCARTWRDQWVVYKRDLNKRYVWAHPPLFVQMCSIVTIVCAGVPFCVLKLVRPHEFTIGHSPLATMLFILMRTMFLGPVAMVITVSGVWG